MRVTLTFLLNFKLTARWRRKRPLCDSTDNADVSNGLVFLRYIILQKI